MKRTFNRILATLAVALCAAIVCAQDTKPTPDTNGGDEDRVYKPEEVDVRVKIDSRTVADLPKIAKDCPKTGLVILSAVLRKSRKVTDVKLLKGVGCSFDQLQMEELRKLKFTPARKAGHAVSQSANFQIWIPRH